MPKFPNCAMEANVSSGSWSPCNCPTEQPPVDPYFVVLLDAVGFFLQSVTQFFPPLSKSAN